MIELKVKVEEQLIHQFGKGKIHIITITTKTTKTTKTKFTSLR
jgi:hypothetical protein